MSRNVVYDFEMNDITPDCYYSGIHEGLFNKNGVCKSYKECRMKDDKCKNFFQLGRIVTMKEVCEKFGENVVIKEYMFN